VLAEERGRAEALTADLERRERTDPFATYELVWAYAALGDSARALDALERSVARGVGAAAVQRVANEPWS
jgi:hypothetical protein